MTLGRWGAARRRPVDFGVRGESFGWQFHPAVASVGVYLTVQLSRNACVVPVLAATCGPGSVRSPWQPNSRQRLRSSDMIAPRMNATSGLIARYSFFVGS